MHLRLDGPSSTNTQTSSRSISPTCGGVVGELVILPDGVPFLALRDDATPAEYAQARRWMDTLLFRDRVLYRPALSVN